jgi:hypothetical protein
MSSADLDFRDHNISRAQGKLNDFSDYITTEASLIITESQLQTAVHIAKHKERERIIDLALSSYDFYKEVSDAEFKLPDGNDVIEVNEVHMIFNRFRAWAHEQITREQK